MPFQVLPVTIYDIEKLSIYVSILTALQDSKAVARARIPVEKIKAPVILLSAGDDAAWPSSLYSKMVVDSLKLNN